MQPEGYLTIDDSPSPHMDALTDFLTENAIPALLFCRGERMEEYPDVLVRAAASGLILGNHTYSHRPAGDLSFEDIIEEIEKTEALIDAVYRRAKIPRPGKYFRFPYLDKGDGDRLERRFVALVQAVAAGNPPALPRTEKVQKIQDYLKREGFTQPFPGVTHPLYRIPSIADAADCLLTYTANDWMLRPDHLGRQACKTMDDLARQMEEDPWFLHPGNGPQIPLFHDHPGLSEVTIALLRHLRDKGFSFLPMEGVCRERSNEVLPGGHCRL